METLISRQQPFDITAVLPLTLYPKRHCSPSLPSSDMNESQPTMKDYQPVFIQRCRYDTELVDFCSESILAVFSVKGVQTVRSIFREDKEFFDGGPGHVDGGFKSPL